MAPRRSARLANKPKPNYQEPSEDEEDDSDYEQKEEDEEDDSEDDASDYDIPEHCRTKSGYMKDDFVVDDDDDDDDSDVVKQSSSLQQQVNETKHQMDQVMVMMQQMQLMNLHQPIQQQVQASSHQQKQAVASTSPLDSQLLELLNSLKFSHYISIFEKETIYSFEDLDMISEQELIDFGISKFASKRLKASRLSK
jgi:hypothetical protein